MSWFGQRMALANKIVDSEFTDPFLYQPMREVVNAEPEIDTSRAAGLVRAIIYKPGMVLGSSWSLNAMHERTSAETAIFFMARGLLVNVQKHDRFTLGGPFSNPDAPEMYECSDGPSPYGFGRWKVVVLQLNLAPTDPLPPQGQLLHNPLGKKTAAQLLKGSGLPEDTRLYDLGDDIPF